MFNGKIAKNQNVTLIKAGGEKGNRVVRIQTCIETREGERTLWYELDAKYKEYLILDRLDASRGFDRRLHVQVGVRSDAPGSPDRGDAGGQVETRRRERSLNLTVPRPHEEHVVV